MGYQLIMEKEQWNFSSGIMIHQFFLTKHSFMSGFFSSYKFSRRSLKGNVSLFGPSIQIKYQQTCHRHATHVLPYPLFYNKNAVTIEKSTKNALLDEEDIENPNWLMNRKYDALLCNGMLFENSEGFHR